MSKTTTLCRTCWRSSRPQDQGHICNKPVGHAGQHHCLCGATRRDTEATR